MLRRLDTLNSISLRKAVASSSVEGLEWPMSLLVSLRHDRDAARGFRFLSG